ncbi:Transcriptional regulatory protein moc3-like protein 5 [Phlyctema vagabunda]|uniref:Transcriptional regulatory protein moc3-like protein 5 n=1 Tax=Phlyctema vagabunda TaxID=108571 RepID=A0ABR4P520_9HELO
MKHSFGALPEWVSHPYQIYYVTLTIPSDICGALISQDLPLIPIQRWASNKGLNEDIKLFRNPTNGFDTYANFAVFLCASCTTLVRSLKTKIPSLDPETRSDESRWAELYGHLEEWWSSRPEEMKPILTIPASEAKNGSPFPTVLYGNGPAVSGNQLYHTATLLMLQERPSYVKVSKQQKSIFWHARQICAISLSNTHHGAWTNSIQPIWLAGKVMSHPSEHLAILNILEMIERETGWATAWRREDLKSWWGDSDD